MHGRMYLGRGIATPRATSSAQSSEGSFVLLVYVTHGDWRQVLPLFFSIGTVEEASPGMIDFRKGERTHNI